MREDRENIQDLQKQIKKLSRQNRQLEQELRVIRIMNEQVSLAQNYIQRESHKQIIYNDQLLKSSPYLLVMTDENLDTVMASDVFCRVFGRSRGEIEHGTKLDVVMAGVMPPDDIKDFLEKCHDCLEKKYDFSYILNTLIWGEGRRLHVEIGYYMDDLESIKGLNILLVDVTEIIDALERAENADKAKSNFLANMSHEIRTPMNAIYGMAEFIMRDSTDEMARNNAAMIKSASKSLIAIINDILDFSKIESGRMELVEDPYSFKSMINDVTAMISVRMQDKDVKLLTDISPDIPDRLFGDEVRVKQILVNILNNAVKFTQHGSIKLSIRHEKITAYQSDRDDFDHNEKCRLLVSVQDTGIGIKESDLEKIFDNFTQVDTRRNRSIEGTGLGLAICRRLIDMMNGTLDVHSEYGKGSTFSFTVESHVLDWAGIGDLSNNIADARNKIFSVDFQAPDARILVVDDNDMNIKVAKGVFRPYGIEPECATSGAKAIELVRKNRYDIIFMDHMMPVMDGAQAMEKIRHLDDRQDSIIIALTANAISGAEENYRQMGFSGFLAKPIEPAEMDTILKNFLPEELIVRNNSVHDNDSSNYMDDVIELSFESDDASALTAESLAKACPDLDIDRGISYCMDDWDFYVELLGDYANDEKESQIESAYNSGQFDQYAILVHALKSTSRTIGAMTMGDLAYELELAAKEGNIELIIDKHRDTMNYYSSIKNNIRNWLSS